MQNCSGSLFRIPIQPCTGKLPPKGRTESMTKKRIKKDSDTTVINAAECTDNTKARRKLPFEMDNTADTTEDEISKLNGIKFVDNMHDMSITEISSEGKFAVDCLSVTKAQNWHFTPLSISSMEELGPLIHITKCS